MFFVCSSCQHGEKVKQQQCDNKPGYTEGVATEQTEADRLAGTVLQEGNKHIISTTICTLEMSTGKPSNLKFQEIWADKFLRKLKACESKVK